MPMTRRKRFFRHLPAYLFVAPAMVVLGVFVLLPMLTAVGLSFTSWNIVGAIKWVGLKNYALMLADPTFARGLLNTVTYTLAGGSNTETGWGRAGESWNAMEALAALGGETWFRLGDHEAFRGLVDARRFARSCSCRL